MISPDRVLHVYTHDHFPSYLGHHGVTHTNKNVREREREGGGREGGREKETERKRKEKKVKSCLSFYM